MNLHPYINEMKNLHQLFPFYLTLNPHHYLELYVLYNS